MINGAVKITKGDFQAYVCPRLGGNVVKLTHKGADVLRPLTDEADLQISQYLYGSPILMPANRTYKGKFVFEGKEYSLPVNEPHNDCNLHGSVLYEEFELVHASADSVTLRLIDKEAKSYPFPFSLTVTYRVSDEGFFSEYTVENIGKGNMPLTFCTHTTFIEPESFSVPIDLCQEKDAHHIPTGRYVPLKEQEKGYVTGSPSQNVFITGYFRSCGNTARIGDYLYTVSDNYDHWILYNGQGKSGLLCVEPQAGAVNGLNQDGAHLLLKKNENITFTTLISTK